MARRMNGNTTQKTIPTLDNGHRQAPSNVEKADLLAETYAQASSTQNYSRRFRLHINRNNLHHIPGAVPSAHNEDVDAMNNEFDLQELQTAINSAKMHKSPGEDKIPYEMIKHLSKPALKVLLDIYNCAWNSGTLPGDWKHAIVVPFIKPGKDPSKPESYRPIALTSSLCKIMERMVTDRFQWFLERGEILTKDQAGFRKNRSTVDQIIRMQDKISKSLQGKEHVLGVFIDFEKAYDMIHVPTLMRKIRGLGITGKVYDWVKDFLTDRTIQVKVGAALSQKHTLENGTPQGSVISPLLFLIMINDMPNNTSGVALSLFADDSAIFAAGRSSSTLEQRIQNSLSAIQKWCDRSGFKISPSKTTAVLFTHSRQRGQDIRLTVNGQDIDITDSAKFLGVIFDRRLSWKPHIDYTITKCRRRMGLLRAVSGQKWGASKRALLMIYRALIRPVLEYGHIAIANANDTDKQRLQTIQTECLRICCGAAKGTPAIGLQNECGEIPLHLRRQRSSLREAVKILTKPNHTAREAMMDHWTIQYGKHHKDRAPLYSRTRDFFEGHFQECRGPVVQKAPPWKNNKIGVDISLTNNINKKTVSPEVQKALALETIERYKEHCCIYTDGSKLEDRTAAAVYIPSTGEKLTLRLADSSSVYAAELSAIREAINWITENKHRIITNRYAIFTDSLSAADSIKNRTATSRPNLLTEVFETNNLLRTEEVTVIWIPSHVNITGNEEADKAAKEGLQLGAVNCTTYIEWPELYTKIDNYILEAWQKEYNDSPTGTHYKKTEPMVSTKIKYQDNPRGREVQITRLRLGRVLLNEWLYRIKHHPDGLCELCKTPDTIEHLLLKCNRNDISNRLNRKCDELKLECNITNLCNGK